MCLNFERSSSYRLLYLHIFYIKFVFQVMLSVFHCSKIMLLTFGSSSVSASRFPSNGWKGTGSPILDGLPNDGRSQARSHYCPTRVLLAARSPAWPSTHLLRQPGDPGLLQRPHIDARLSADTRSTQTAAGKGSRPQEIHDSKPPSSRITGARHHSQRLRQSWFLIWSNPQPGAELSSFFVL